MGDDYNVWSCSFILNVVVPMTNDQTLLEAVVETITGIFNHVVSLFINSKLRSFGLSQVNPA